MAKVVFYYGSMNSSKSAQLIMTAFNFKAQGKSYIALKSAKDTRDKNITSRALKISLPCTPIVEVEDIEKAVQDKQPDWIFVDEVQFMTEEMINTLAAIADRGINVVCYGLLTNFQGYLFPGSKRLVECAESIREIKNQCIYCENKAIRNMRLVNNMPIFEGPLELPGDSYDSVCRSCYEKFKRESAKKKRE
ncbi:thymidine kinase [Gottfriedia acidiceleris]|uniref:thymidine kinase n=1 Tax=Gottfriedia acidiceleris TaxID=371036 RepID=UPI003392EA27